MVSMPEISLESCKDIVRKNLSLPGSFMEGGRDESFCFNLLISIDHILLL